MLVVLLVLLASIKEGILRVSSCWKDTPVWLLRTNVYTWSFVNENTPEEDGVTSSLFLSNTLEIGPEALDVPPVTFSPLVTSKLELATTLR